ncbi:MAG: diaminopimelate epimerase [Verrucomicrobiota bacterium]|nr:diaminopimelate epimerase [Verrucomicrobiota bacterium]
MTFTKMHGLGNDYIYFDCIDNPSLIEEPSLIAEKLSDRHFGIGGDGIVLILSDNEADFRMRMFNSDGSEAEMCGNAIRCVGKFVYDNDYTDKKTIKIATGAGIKILELNIEQRVVKTVRVNMGEPILNGFDIPVNINKEIVMNEEVSMLDGKKYNMTCVSMGNPHAVIFVNEIKDRHVLIDGKELEFNKIFPQKINVEFARIISEGEVQMRVWERGAGETLACGTGASAVCVASVLNKKTGKSIIVKLLGGDLFIEWAEDNNVYMTGPAEVAFHGTVEI